MSVDFHIRYRRLCMVTDGHMTCFSAVHSGRPRADVCIRVKHWPVEKCMIWFLVSGHERSGAGSSQVMEKLPE